MRSLLVVALFTHAEAQVPEDVVVSQDAGSSNTSTRAFSHAEAQEDVVVPQNANSSDSSTADFTQAEAQGDVVVPQNASSYDSSIRSQHQQDEQSQKMRQKYMNEYAGQYADYAGDQGGEHNETDMQSYYKNKYVNKYGGGGHNVTETLAHYKNKYASQYTPPQATGPGGADLKDYYMNKFVPVAYRHKVPPALENKGQVEPQNATAEATATHAAAPEALVHTIDSVQATPAPSEEAAALAPPAGKGRWPWALVLCAFVGGSIPVAFAAWRRQRFESCEEESTRFLLMV